MFIEYQIYELIRNGKTVYKDLKGVHHEPATEMK
jgi:hypothetical protein